jgi:hypothetical protein
MAFNPELANMWAKTPDMLGFIPSVKWKNKTLSALATMAIVRRQLQRLGKSKKPKPNSSPLLSLIMDRVRLARLTKRYRKYVLGED